DLRRRVVDPAFTWRGGERNRAKPLEPFVAGWIPCSERCDRLRERRGGGRGRRAIADAVHEDVPHGDGSRRRFGAIERSFRIEKDLAVRKFRQPALDRIVERHLAVLDQYETRSVGDRLRHRREAEDRVALDRNLLLTILPAN